MCGACGTGLALPPWEVSAHGGTARDLRDRAREAEDLCAGRLRIRPFGPAGYQTTGRTGRISVHSCLDSLVAELVRDHSQHILPALADPRQTGSVAQTLRAQLDVR